MKYLTLFDSLILIRGWKHTMVVHFGQENVLIFNTFCIILGVDFFSFHLDFWKTIKMDFCHKSSFTIIVIFQMIVFFQKHLCIHTFMLVWMKNLIHVCFLWNHMNGPFHIELKWDNEFICNIWLNTSLSLVIIWMIFEIYLQFIVY